MVATAVTVVGGTVIGLAAGYFGGIVDSMLARFMDWLLAVPFLLFAIALFSVAVQKPIFGFIGPGLPIVIIVLGFFGWASVGRLVRGQVLSIKEKEYIEAARALGAGPWRIMFIDILPNLLAPLIVYSTLLIPATIVGEAHAVVPRRRHPAADGGLGRDDLRQRPACSCTGLVVPASSRAWRCWSRRWPSTSSATGSGMPLILAATFTSRSLQWPDS